jgi:hypothetical protein
MSVRNALMAYAEAWVYPILGNEDVRESDRLFTIARELGSAAVAGSDDPPEFAEWLKSLLARTSPETWEDTLFAVTAYFGLPSGK